MAMITNSSSQNYRWLALVLTIGSWGLLQYQWGNRLYILFMIAFLLVAIVFHRHHIILLTIFAGTIMLFNTPALHTLTKLEQLNLSILQKIKPSLANIFTPNSGQEALPIQVRRMLSLLQTNRITKYQLSYQLIQEAITQQRIIESAWPIRPDATAHYFLYLAEEPRHAPTCVEIDQRKDVVLVYCP
jgi:hypothetical protein